MGAIISGDWNLISPLLHLPVEWREWPADCSRLNSAPNSAVFDSTSAYFNTLARFTALDHRRTRKNIFVYNLVNNAIHPGNEGVADRRPGQYSVEERFKFMKKKSEPIDEQDDSGGRQRGIQSVEQAVELLSVFIGSSSPMSLKAIAEKANMGTSSTHRYLVSLRRSGLVLQDEVTGFYDVGPMALNLGLAFMRRVDALGAAENAARRLAMNTKQTAFVSIWTERGPAVVRWFHGEDIIISSTHVGAVLPLFQSSTGKVFAAYMPELMFDKLAKADKKYIFADLKAQREEVRAHGYAWINELTPGLFAVAAPVKDMHGHAAAVVTLLSTEPALVDLPNGISNALLLEVRKASETAGFLPENRPD